MQVDLDPRITYIILDFESRVVVGNDIIMLNILYSSDTFAVSTQWLLCWFLSRSQKQPLNVPEPVMHAGICVWIKQECVECCCTGKRLFQSSLLTKSSNWLLRTFWTPVLSKQPRDDVFTCVIRSVTPYTSHLFGTVYSLYYNFFYYCILSLGEIVIVVVTK